jgi:hypothetical protein
MKFFNTLLFILISTCLTAQKAKDNEKFMSKTLWDISLGFGFLKQNSPTFVGSAQITTRFRNKLYCNISYIETFDPIPDITIPFGTAISSSNDNSPYVKNMSLVAGTYLNIKFFYIAIGVGPTNARGYSYDDNLNKGTKFNVIGLDNRVQIGMILSRHIGFGINYNYNINRIKSFQYTLLSLNIGNF